MTKRNHFLISGRVQGVGYRYFLLDYALSNNLSGWCQNKADGRVEAEFYTTPEQLEALEVACWQGPDAAKVDSVTVTELAYSGNVPETFEIRR